MAHKDRLLKPKEVAARLNVKTDYVLQLFRAEQLDGIQLSERVIRIFESSVEQFIDDHRR